MSEEKKDIFKYALCVNRAYGDSLGVKDMGFAHLSNMFSRYYLFTDNETEAVMAKLVNFSELTEAEAYDFARLSDGKKHRTVMTYLHDVNPFTMYKALAASRNSISVDIGLLIKYIFKHRHAYPLNVGKDVDNDFVRAFSFIRSYICNALEGNYKVQVTANIGYSIVEAMLEHNLKIPRARPVSLNKTQTTGQSNFYVLERTLDMLEKECWAPLFFEDN